MNGKGKSTVEVTVGSVKVTVKVTVEMTVHVTVKVVGCWLCSLYFTEKLPRRPPSTTIPAPRASLSNRSLRHCRICSNASPRLAEIAAENSNLTLFPIKGRIIGFHEGLLETLKTFIGRSDLPTQVLSCDTTFHLGLLYGTFVIFRHTEILESPSILEHICSYFTCFMKAKLQRIIKLFGSS